MVDGLHVSEEFNNEITTDVSGASLEQLKEYFSSYSKEDLLKYLKSYSVDDHEYEALQVLKTIKSHYDHILEQEIEQALQKFLANGGEVGDFEYRKDETSIEIEKSYSKLKDTAHQHIQQVEKQKIQNVEKKKAILEQMRVILSSDESADSHKQFRELQDSWKSAGPVPAADNKELWSNYQALTDMYYNKRSMYFELKELDRKKNLELKQQLVAKAEALLDTPSINKALAELRKIQEEFKNIGPVPKEEAEALWNKFKAALDALNEKRKLFFDNLQEQKKHNLVQKELLIAKIKELEEFVSDKIDDWKEKSDLILAIQEEWKKVGPVPEEHIKDVTKQFWTSAKKFFANKSHFFKELDEKRKENLDKKIALCVQAEALKDSSDVQGTAKKLMNLQNEWKKIGQVPIKYKDSIYSRFKSACDSFFERQRNLVAEAESALQVNLSKKESFIQEVENKLADGIEEVHNWLSHWESLGDIPGDKRKEVSDKFKQVLTTAVDKIENIGEEREKLLLQIEVKLSGAKKVESLLKDLQKKAGIIKAEVDRYKTNMEFLANSPKASSLKEEVQKKIQDAEVELKKINEKISILRKF
jgi:hypothetical protein